MLADVALALDPCLLAERAGLALDGWQRDALRTPSKRLLVNASRQSGKSTVAAVKGVHTALYEPRATVLFLSPSLRQSQELFRASLSVFRALGRPIEADAETALRLELENHSRIVSLPATETTIRGIAAPRLIVFDEASRVPDSLFASVLPMIATAPDATVMGLSTPNGRQGWWAERWFSDEPWERFEIPATQCPRITPAFLEEVQQTMGRYWFEQEFLVKFVDAAGQVFKGDDIAALLDPSVTPLWPDDAPPFAPPSLPPPLPAPPGYVEVTL